MGWLRGDGLENLTCLLIKWCFLGARRRGFQSPLGQWFSLS